MSSGFQFIEQPLFIKNCGPATTIPMTIYTDSGTYEGCQLEIAYVSISSDASWEKTISLDNYEYDDTGVQKIKGFFENDMWTGTSGNMLTVIFRDNTGAIKKVDDIEVVEEEWTLRESLENAYNELHTFLKEQNLVYLDLSEASGFGSLINKVDEYMACKIITNPDQYSGHPSKNLTLISGQLPLLRNTGVGQPVLHREFTKKTNYTLTFAFQTSVGNRTGFSYGFDPSMASGSNLDTSSGAHGLDIKTDIGNTYIETFDNGSTIQLYTHTSNLFTAEGTHIISIHRNGMTAKIYIDKDLIYTHDNVKYNTIGLNKWGSGYNQISNIQISIDPEYRW